VGLGPWSLFVRHVESAALFAVFGLSIAAAFYQVRRFRRASGERRQQLKWLGSAAAVCALALPTFVWQNAPPLVADLLPLALTAVPIAIGVGILRYRLYEIDRLFSRTLSYVILTALLAGTFVGVVALTTDLLPFSSGVGVAASTLAATVLFNPLRRRVQRIVDRRFNRSRYDAERIVEAFAARLRDAVELESVQTELLDVVQRALEPAHASLWIRPSAPAPRPALPLDQGPHARVERVTR
jgi:N-terminal 7TM region of histidine kinase